MFRNLDSDYKVIIVGDAAMAPEELYSDSGNYRGPNGGLPGWDWLCLIKRHYKKVVWMNPKMAIGLHSVYKLKWGHYKYCYKLCKSSKTIYIANSLSGGYLQARSFSTMLGYINAASYPSILVVEVE